MVRYIYIFHLKNAAGVNNEFWNMFINLWIFFTMTISNGVNWFLPGLYSNTYEMCTCTFQDYRLHPKFDNINSVLTMVTVTVYAIVSARIKIYNKKAKSMVHPTEQTKLAKNKFIADITLTIGPALLLIFVFLANYFLSTTRSNISNNQYPSYYLVIHAQYLISLPLILAIFVILFYAKNKNVKKVLLRELRNNQWNDKTKVFSFSFR